MDQIVDDLINNRVSELDLSQKCSNINDLKKLCDALKENTSLTTLILRKNGIDKERIKFITDALKENRSLNTLDIYWNNIRRRGLVYIRDLLQHNTTLTNINVGYNHIYYLKAANYIVDIINQTTNLNTFITCYNQLENSGLEIIANALEHNYSITDMGYLAACKRNIEYCNRNKHNIELKGMRLVDL